MPEGHTIHRVAADHTRDFAGQRLSVSSPPGAIQSGSKKVKRADAVGGQRSRKASVL